MKHTLFLLLATSAAAMAHEGHGLPGASHWHATDAWGLLIAPAGAAALGLAWWWGRRK